MVNFVDHVKCRGNGTAKCGMWRNSQIIETQVRVCVCIDFICVKSVLRVFDIFFPSRLHWLKLAIGRRRVAFVTLLRWIFVTPTYVIVVARLIVNNVRTKFIFIWTNMCAFFCACCVCQLHQICAEHIMHSARCMCYIVEYSETMKIMSSGCPFIGVSNVFLSRHHSLSRSLPSTYLSILNTLQF